MKRFCNKKLDCIADTGKEVAGLLKAGNEDSARSRVRLFLLYVNNHGFVAAKMGTSRRCDRFKLAFELRSFSNCGAHD